MPPTFSWQYIWITWIRPDYTFILARSFSHRKIQGWRKWRFIWGTCYATVSHSILLLSNKFGSIFISVRMEQRSISFSATTGQQLCGENRSHMTLSPVPVHLSGFRSLKRRPKKLWRRWGTRFRVGRWLKDILVARTLTTACIEIVPRAWGFKKNFDQKHVIIVTTWRSL